MSLYIWSFISKNRDEGRIWWQSGRKLQKSNMDWRILYYLLMKAADVLLGEALSQENLES